MKIKKFNEARVSVRDVYVELFAMFSFRIVPVVGNCRSSDARSLLPAFSTS